MKEFQNLFTLNDNLYSLDHCKKIKTPYPFSMNSDVLYYNNTLFQVVLFNNKLKLIIHDSKLTVKEYLHIFTNFKLKNIEIHEDRYLVIFLTTSTFNNNIKGVIVIDIQTYEKCFERCAPDSSIIEKFRIIEGCFITVEFCYDYENSRYIYNIYIKNNDDEYIESISSSSSINSLFIDNHKIYFVYRDTSDVWKMIWYSIETFTKNEKIISKHISSKCIIEQGYVVVNYKKTVEIYTLDLQKIQEVRVEHDDYIYELHIFNNYICLFFEEKIMIYDIYSGNLLLEKEIKKHFTSIITSKNCMVIKTIEETTYVIDRKLNWITINNDIKSKVIFLNNYVIFLTISSSVDLCIINLDCKKTLMFSLKEYTINIDFNYNKLIIYSLESITIFSPIL